MHLVYVSNGRIPSHKAYSVQIVKMCEAFSHATMHGEKVEVTLVTADSKYRLKEDVCAFYGVTHSFRVVRCPSLEWHWLGKTGHLLQLLTFALVATVRALVLKPDVIYSRDEVTGFFLSLCTNRLVYEIHTKRPLIHIRAILRNVHHCVAITKGLKDFYVRTWNILPEKVLVAPDAVSPERFESPLTKSELRVALGLPEDRLIVGHLGKITTMGKGKGVEELIEGFPAVKKKHPHALLFLAGVEEHEKPYINELCAAAGIAREDVTVVGHIPQKEFPQYFLVCDVLVMAYPDLEHYRLFMSPIKLFEYMASGIPMVTTDLPSVREILDESLAVFVRPGDAEDMARGVHAVLADQEAAATRAEKARREVKEKYTWEKRAHNILKFIQTHGN